MRNHADDVVNRAIEILDRHGLADLTMRRLGRELEVQPSAIYHHFESKQTLLAAVADEVLHRQFVPAAEGTWEQRVVDTCGSLRTALQSVRDGAEVVATVYSFGLGAAAPAEALQEALADSSLSPSEVRAGVDVLLHFVFGHVLDEQTHAQAATAGARLGDRAGRSDFATGITIIVAGLKSGASPARRVEPL